MDLTLSYPNSYIAFDFETTGLDPKTDKILEIGALKIEDGKITEAGHWMLNHGIDIPAEATAIHGIDKDEIERDGVDPHQALSEFIEFLDPYRSVIPNLTHNGYKFDIPFLFNAVGAKQLLVLKSAMSRGCIDTAVIYKGRKIPLQRLWNESFCDYAARVMDTRVAGLKYSVAHCCKELEISVEGIRAHRALADIELTHKIYQKLCQTSSDSTS